MNYIYGIKIKTSSYDENESIGLYTVNNSESELRWSEYELHGVTNAYKSGILDAVSEINKNSNLNIGGGVCSADGLKITFHNNRRLVSTLENNGVSLTGLKIDLVEFVGTDTDSDSVEIYTHYSGFIESVVWGELTGELNIKSSRHKRRSNLGTIIDNDSIIPVTFGSSDPAAGRYFKAIGNNNTETILRVEDLAQKTGVYHPAKMELFPVCARIGSSPSKTYQIRLGYMDSEALPDGDFFVDKWVLVKEGDGSNQYAKIKTCSIEGTGNAYIEVEFYDYLEKELTGTWDADQAGQSWLQFVDINKSYSIDSAECIGFCDSSGTAITNKIDIFSKNSNDKVIQLSHFGYDADVNDANNASMIINPILFSGNTSDMNSFMFLPVNSLAFCDSSNLVDWGFNPARTKLEDGVFRSATGNIVNSTITKSVSDSSLFDKNLNTNSYITATLEVDSSLQGWINAYTFRLPELPKISFSDIYLGINAEISSNETATIDTILHVVRKGYINRIKLLNQHTLTNSQSNNSVYFDNIPDFYIERNENNLHFFTNLNTASNKGGYKLIDLDVSTESDYYGIDQVLIAFERATVSVGEFTETTKIKELFLMVRSTSNIQDEIYV